MARAATSSDAFNAVGEPCRRDILSYLALGERSVGEIVDALECGQPSVSKHLRVLRSVGLVRSRRDGRRTLCRLDASELRSLHEWTARFEHLWRRQLRRVKQRAEQRTRVDGQMAVTKAPDKKEKLRLSTKSGPPVIPKSGPPAIDGRSYFVSSRT